MLLTMMSVLQNVLKEFSAPNAGLGAMTLSSILDNCHGKRVDVYTTSNRIADGQMIPIVCQQKKASCQGKPCVSLAITYPLKYEL